MKLKTLSNAENYEDEISACIARQLETDSGDIFAEAVGTEVEHYWKIAEESTITVQKAAGQVCAMAKAGVTCEKLRECLDEVCRYATAALPIWHIMARGSDSRRK